jgi:hypothetical protein
MAHLILEPLGIPTPALPRNDAEPRSINGDLGADGIAPVAVTETLGPPTRVRRGWLRFFDLGPEVAIARANLSYLDEMMLDLP